MRFSFTSALIIFSSVTFTLASLTINELCSYQIPSDGTPANAIICLKADQPLDQFPTEISGTASIGATAVKLCCQYPIPILNSSTPLNVVPGVKGDTCLLSNATSPEVMCYNPTYKTASSRLQSIDCTLQNGKCIGKYLTGSTDGVLTVTSIVDGKGITGSSGGADPGAAGASSGTASSAAPQATGSSKPNVGIASAVILEGQGGIVIVAALAAVAGWLIM